MQAIRVFISSTFQDMHAERDALAGIAFPALRARFEPQGVVVNEIDLRWGISREDAAESRVLPICLAEIDNCRPFFIAVLGDRYGWVDPAAGQLIADRFLHLSEFASCSLTELEIRHALLNPPPQAAPLDALVYVRTSATSGNYAAAVQTLLKAIEHRMPQAVRRFTSATDLARMVEHDLAELVCQRLANEHRSDPGSWSALLARTVGGIARPETEAAILRLLSRPGSRVLLHAPRGAGKTTVLANLIAAQPHLPRLAVAGTRWAKGLLAGLVRPPGSGKTLWVGSPHSALGTALDWRAAVADIGAALTGAALPSMDAEALLTHVRALLDQDRQCAVVVCLDGLDDLGGDPRGTLAWISRLLSPRVSVIATCSDPDLRDRLVDAGFVTMELPAWSAEQARRACEAYFAAYGKRITPEQNLRLSGGEVGANPGSLRLRMEELRLFGRFDLLDQEIGRLAQLDSLRQLLGAVIGRVRSDPQLPGAAMCDLLLHWSAAVRTGLTDAELSAFLAAEGVAVTRRELSSVLTALSPLLAVRSGMVTLRTSALRPLLEDLPEHAKAKVRLAEHLANMPDAWRARIELPTLLADADRWHDLAAYLARPAVITALTGEAYQELLSFARACELQAPGSLIATLRETLAGLPHESRAVESALLQLLLALRESATVVAHIDRRLTTPLLRPQRALYLGFAAESRQIQGNAHAARVLLEDLANLLTPETPHRERLRCLKLLAANCLECGDVTAARTHVAALRELDANGVDAADIEMLDANILIHDGKWREAEERLRELRDLAGRNGDLILQRAALGGLASVARRQDKPRLALEFLSEEEKLCLTLNDRSGLHQCLGAQGLCHLRRGNLDTALKLFETKLALAQQILDRPGEVDAMYLQADVFRALGQPATAHRLALAAKIHAERHSMPTLAGGR